MRKECAAIRPYPGNSRKADSARDVVAAPNRPDKIWRGPRPISPGSANMLPIRGSWRRWIQSLPLGQFGLLHKARRDLFLPSMSQSNALDHRQAHAFRGRHEFVQQPQLPSLLATTHSLGSLGVARVSP